MRERVRELEGENRGLRRERERSLDRLRGLGRVAHALHSVLDLPQLLRLVVRSATRELRAEVGSLMLVEEGLLRIAAAKGLPEKVIRDTRMPLGEGIAGWVAANGKSVLVEDLRRDSRFSPSRRSRYKNHGALSVPLVHGETVLGVLNVNNKRGGAPFDGSDLEYLETLASQAAIAIANASLLARTYAQATTDGLTGLRNHRFFHERLAAEMERSRRYGGHPVSLLMADLDHFKECNDRYGHGVGDEVLKAVAEVLQRQARRPDTVARYGGEEFALILPEVAKAQAGVMAERVRRTFSEQPIEAGGVRHRLTLSIGVASYPEDARDSAELIRQADAALYVAKGTRDAVRIFEERAGGGRRRRARWPEAAGGA